MAVTTIKTALRCGLDATITDVTCEVSEGSGVFLTGLNDTLTKELFLRVTTAIQSCGFFIPGKKISINIDTKGMKNFTGAFDLPVAIAIIVATGQAKPVGSIANVLAYGELELDGSVRFTPGCFQTIQEATKHGIVAKYIPWGNTEEVRPISNYNMPVYPIEHLSQVIDNLTSKTIGPTVPDIPVKDWGYNVREKDDVLEEYLFTKYDAPILDAIEIAAAGGHHMMMFETPSANCYAIARAINVLRPDLTGPEKKEIARIYSSADRGDLLACHGIGRHVRVPRYDVPFATLVGTGLNGGVPGEFSLAHKGILYISQFHKMPKVTMESLRVPLEEKKDKRATAQGDAAFPAQMQLMASMPTCPCGHDGDGTGRCRCTNKEKKEHLNRLSGTVMQHIDLCCTVVPLKEPKKDPPALLFEKMRERVRRAVDAQEKRFQGTDIRCNADIPYPRDMRIFGFGEGVEAFVGEVMMRRRMKADSFGPITRMARTIADLEGRETIIGNDVLKAASFRSRVGSMDK